MATNNGNQIGRDRAEKRQKTLKTVLNILLVIAALFFVFSISDVVSSYQNKQKNAADKQRGRESSLQYELEHQAFGEVVKSYFTYRCSDEKPPKGLEPEYLIGEYANTAFLKRMYAKKGDSDGEQACAEKLADLRKQLGDYLFAADQIDELLVTY